MGDSVRRNEDSYNFIIGHVDDMLNMNSHHIGRAQVENTLVVYKAVAQAAVVGQPHKVKVQAICTFCMLTKTVQRKGKNTKTMMMLW